MQYILPKNVNIMNTLSSKPFSLPNEILCTKPVIVASAYVLFIQAYYINIRRQEHKQQKQLWY